MTEGLAGIKSGGWFSEAASVVGNQVLIFAPSVTVPAFGDHSQGSLEPPSPPYRALGLGFFICRMGMVFYVRSEARRTEVEHLRPRPDVARSRKARRRRRDTLEDQCIGKRTAGPCLRVQLQGPAHCAKAQDRPPARRDWAGSAEWGG